MFDRKYYTNGMVGNLGKLAYSLSGLKIDKNLNPPKAAKYELSN